MRFLNVVSGLMGAVFSVILLVTLTGCGTPPPPDGLAEASAMGERPVAMQGSSEFFDGEIVATVTVSRGIGRGQGGGTGSESGGGRGGRAARSGGGGRGGPPPDMAGMDPEQAAAYQNARMALGSPMPPVTTRLKLENRGKETLEIEILEVSSDLGNFAVRPAKISVPPGQTAEPDPMISQLGVTSGEIPVKVRLRKIDGGAVPATAGTPPVPAETQVIAVVSVSKTGTPGAEASK